MCDEGNLPVCHISCCTALPLPTGTRQASSSATRDWNAGSRAGRDTEASTQIREQAFHLCTDASRARGGELKLQRRRSECKQQKMEKGSRSAVCAHTSCEAAARSRGSERQHQIAREQRLHFPHCSDSHSFASKSRNNPLACRMNHKQQSVSLVVKVPGGCGAAV
ncbi:unnamed protein product [Pleuronectes platessa]|uniref:Uncharacterized protein n=1 Tax=Pleuronectes platessa TaxID=8262 RepID=A0A9N7VEM5_PLEPL|nr:unnamed protein product [Pleuronectes platessa]